MSPASMPERLPLARTPAILDLWQRAVGPQGAPQGVPAAATLPGQMNHGDLWVWRDDLTGFEGSGNKVRKLEFLLADALTSGATHIVTCGGPQSNHARATVWMARQYGLPTTVVVREPETGLGALTGNLLLTQLAGGRIAKVTMDEYREAGAVYDSFLEQEAAAIRADGGRPYIIPEGGSNALGCWGYIRAAEELVAAWRHQVGSDAPDRVYVALGSGGTHAGLVLGMARLGVDPTIVRAVNVCDDATYFRQRVGGLIHDAVAEFGLPQPAGALQIVDGHVGDGYAQATRADLALYHHVASTTGRLLDPVYTGKAYQGMLADLGQAPAGTRAVFVHTGGGFGNFAFASAYEDVLEQGGN